MNESKCIILVSPKCVCRDYCQKQNSYPVYNVKMLICNVKCDDLYTEFNVLCFTPQASIKKVHCWYLFTEMTVVNVNNRQESLNAKYIPISSFVNMHAYVQKLLIMKNTHTTL